MDTVRCLLAKKGSHVWSVGKDATVMQGALLMREHNIGSLVVLDRDQVAGIFTERDVLHRVVCEQRDANQTTVGEVLTAEVFCCTPDTPLEEVRSAFMTRRLRHLPVIDAERHLIGVISIGDLNAHLVADQEGTIFALREYLYGRV
jgi:CBS domain-containing protein